MVTSSNFIRRFLKSSRGEAGEKREMAEIQGRIVYFRMEIHEFSLTFRAAQLCFSDYICRNWELATDCD